MYFGWQTRPQSVILEKTMKNIIIAVDLHYLAIESLKGLANDLTQIYLMISIVHLQKVDGALLKTTE